MNNHLKQYRMTLKTMSPIHIGSGETIGKREYIYDKREQNVYFPDLHKIINALKKHSLLGEYEKFLLGKPGDLFRFLTDNRVNWKTWCDKPISVRGVADEQFNQISTFVKDPYGYPYVPGSSLKGAFRTIALCHEARRRRLDPRLPEPRTMRKNPREAKDIEASLLNILERNEKKKSNAVNDIMAAYRFSDSKPISRDALAICRKIDCPTAGKNRDPKSLPTFRECIIPGTLITLTLTIDTALLRGKRQLPDFLELLADFNAAYYEGFQKFFPQTEPNSSNTIYLGGGTGFLTKTMLLGLPSGKRLNFTAGYLDKTFRKHKHHEDIRLGVSPHTLKLTEYYGNLYEMGMCEVDIKEV
ncbi:MAG: type III-A CRISPR-associated RAMP protein Csm5 [Defluviitaleaceae bacterium]|nr:type III-A CRISPR-associated RAMP protein Csm5 [Defluviitaleaceae bacterium]